MKKTNIIAQEEVDILNAYVKDKSATLALASEKLGYTIDELKEKLIKFGYRVRKKDLPAKEGHSEQKQISINFPTEHLEANKAYSYIMSKNRVKRSRWVRDCLYIGMKFENKFGNGWVEEANTLADGRKSIQDEIRQLRQILIDGLAGVKIIGTDGQEKEAKDIVPELNLGDLEF